MTPAQMLSEAHYTYSDCYTFDDNAVIAHYLGVTVDQLERDYETLSDYFFNNSGFDLLVSAQSVFG